MINIELNYKFISRLLTRNDYVYEGKKERKKEKKKKFVVSVVIHKIVMS